MLSDPVARGLRARLLIVDDTPENILLLSETLKETYQVQVANNGARAIAIAQREPRPDLILLDVMMPEMDGYEVCRLLKADPQTAAIPIIFVTALTSSGDEEKGLDLGAVDYVTKPFNPTLVMARVRNQIELKRHRDHLEEEVRRRTEELLQEYLVRRRLESDLELALKLQLSMLAPSRYREGGPHGFHIAGCLRPARTIGGDLYDYFRLDARRLLFAVGDVSDKGVASALFMVRVLTLMHWLAPTAGNPAHLLHLLNQALCRENDACMFVTLALAFVDLESGEIEYASGGHEPPVLFTLGHPADILRLEGGPCLGLYESEFPLHKLSLGPEQCLMLLSDGVTEANNPDKKEFGLSRLTDLFPLVESVEPDEVLATTLKEIDRFTDGAEPSDDLTILTLRLGEAASVGPDRPGGD
jgi:sigma-B regulation protein RsbU (phosphoserine phosphatase)